ncbi:hypothetical protein COB72_04530 [bacterium]|nr:MAG: hypothetical protein COB72_04530 [bacterium]
MKNTYKAIAILALASGLAAADTTQTGPSIYEVDAGVTFDIGNFGSQSFLFTWIDKSGFFEFVIDPTLILTAGETYSFNADTGFHPFIIADGELLPVQGTDGSYFRTTTSGTVLDDATLVPIADFTSDPDGTDPIVWDITEAEVGDYWYTCRIAGHLDMTGRIQVVSGAAACPADLTGDGMLNFFDVSAFLSAFASGDLAADFTGDGMLNFFDVSAFLSAFAAGCP